MAEHWIIFLPSLLFLAGFGIVAYRVMRILKAFRDPDSVSRMLAQRLENVLEQPNVDPATAHELRIRLREALQERSDGQKSVRGVVVESAHDDVHASPDAFHRPLEPDPTPGLGGPPLRVDTPQGSSLRFALCLLAVALGLWAYYSMV